MSPAVSQPPLTNLYREWPLPFADLMFEKFDRMRKRAKEDEDYAEWLAEQSEDVEGHSR